ncbi:MAG: alpha/beta fold hydrolase [Mariniblastus sp.]|nr:alpha/beta fold hydrolase [Mariniblastus sp.]
MRHFLLVHGGSHGQWCWHDLIAQLEARGASASALDLPGHGDDPTPRQTVDRQAYVRAVRDCLESIEATDLTLVGHSLAGIVLPELADRCGVRLQQVVYLAALVCQPGQRAIDLIPEDRRPSYFEQAEASADFTVTWPYEKARQLFFSDLTEERAKWAYQRLTPQPFQVYLDPVPAAVAKCPSRYLICQGDQCLPQASCQEWAERLGARPEMIESGHDVMLSHPGKLAEQLLKR